jgi:cysteine desulfurase/selenocysteine lyase
MTATAASLGAGIAAEFPILTRKDGIGDVQRSLVYLDSSATSQKPRAVLDSLAESLGLHNANIHRGVYPLAVEATDRFENARAIIARFVGIDDAETIFTKNATEAINLVAYSWGRRNVGEGDLIVLTPMEHHSNIVPWQILAEEKGAELAYVELTEDGRLDLDSLDELLGRGPKLVACTHVSNVLGTVNPVEEIARRTHDAGALLLVDGAQAVPQRAVDIRATGADFYAFTGHKLYGPTGIGVLYGRRELLDEMPPFLSGWDMISSVDFFASRWNELPWKFEAGTSPFAEATALGAAVEWIDALGMPAVHAHEAELTGYALGRLADEPGVQVFGPGLEHRGALVSFALEGAHPHDVAEILARENVCVRAGHHCAQPLMRRLGVPATARASFAVHNTRDDVDRLIDAIGAVRRTLQL